MVAMIDYKDKYPYEEHDMQNLQEGKDYYTPEEAYESIMSDIKVIYNLKDAV